MYLEQLIYFCAIDVYECQKQRYIFVCSNALVAMYCAMDVYESQKQRYIYTCVPMNWESATCKGLRADPGNTNGGSITIPLTSCLTHLD